jgi:hypothetical protein
MKSRRPDGREAMKKYALNFALILEFYFIISMIWIFIP